jgi:hypothetical protein
MSDNTPEPTETPDPTEPEVPEVIAHADEEEDSPCFILCTINSSD